MMQEALSAAREVLPWWVSWGPWLVFPVLMALVAALLGWLAGKVRGNAGRLIVLFTPLLGAAALLTGPLPPLPRALLVATTAASSLVASVLAGKRSSADGERSPLGLIMALAVLAAVLLSPIVSGARAALREGMEGEPRALVTMAVLGGSSAKLDELAWLWLGRGEREGAYALLRAAITLPKGASYRVHLSWALSQSGRCEEAESELRAARAEGVIGAGHGDAETHPAAALARCLASRGTGAPMEAPIAPP